MTYTIRLAKPVEPLTTIDIEATTPEEAAKKAKEMSQDGIDYEDDDIGDVVAIFDKDQHEGIKWTIVEIEDEEGEVVQ